MNRLLALLLFVATNARAQSSQLALSWTDNATTEVGFEIERGTGSGSSVVFSPLARVGANVVTYVDTTLQPTTTYSYRVRSYNAGGFSGYTPVASGTTLIAPPAAPSGATVTTPPPIAAITLAPNQRLLLVNTTSNNIRPNPNDPAMALPPGFTANVVATK